MLLCVSHLSAKGCAHLRGEEEAPEPLAVVVEVVLELGQDGGILNRQPGRLDVVVLDLVHGCVELLRALLGAPQPEQACGQAPARRRAARPRRARLAVAVEGRLRGGALEDLRGEWVKLVGRGRAGRACWRVEGRDGRGEVVGARSERLERGAEEEIGRARRLGRA